MIHQNISKTLTITSSRIPVGRVASRESTDIGVFMVSPKTSYMTEQLWTLPAVC